MYADKGIITFGVWADAGRPYICEVYGKYDLNTLKEIEDQFIEEPPDEWEYNVMTITYECYWEPPQTGEYGRIELPGSLL